MYNIVWATLAIRENRFSGRNVSFSSAKQDEWSKAYGYLIVARFYPENFGTGIFETMIFCISFLRFFIERDELVQ